MKFNNRQELEAIGYVGAYSYLEEKEGFSYRVNRMLSSYWLATKDIDPEFVEHLKTTGFWEAWISLWISRNVKPGSKCIDAGANYGYYTFQLALHGCNVIAIEANPQLVPYIQKSIELNGCKDRVEILNKALTNKSGEVLKLGLYESTLHTSVITNRETMVTENKNTCIEVDTITLNDLKFECPIDFIKMDIEGAEEMAFDSSDEFWAQNPDCVLLMEFVPAHYSNYGKDFYDKIISKGFKVDYVDFNGQQQPCPYEFIKTSKEDLQMVVIYKNND